MSLCHVLLRIFVFKVLYTWASCLSFLSLRSLAFKNGMIIPTWSGCKKSNEVTITKFLALRTERINTFNIILFFISFTIHIFYSHFFLLRIHHFDIFSFVWITAKSPSLSTPVNHIHLPSFSQYPKGNVNVKLTSTQTDLSWNQGVLQDILILYPLWLTISFSLTKWPIIFLWYFDIIFFIKIAK